MLSLKDVIVDVGGNGNDFLNYCTVVGKSVIYHYRRNSVKYKKLCEVINVILYYILHRRITFFILFLRSGSSSL